METLKLVEPINFGGEEISELKFRKPKGKDLKHLPCGESMTLGNLASVGAKLAGYPPSFPDELNPTDYMALVEISGKCLAPSLTTGETA